MEGEGPNDLLVKMCILVRMQHCMVTIAVDVQ
jgi:hypothetical protein